ncbi:hypothetical protein [Sphingomonas crocodyli]|uniref:NIPSNAP family protein n=1 Tax=Sphingomonas crocodyli TaxID=1979270 RepID=A0A437LZT5_9SPHN|nr:hypothetical protein [Sphingomonas crocodyli]RVT90866.1 hypothetical protein EOD43_15090 [Sphingomonas crocodyli]
MAKITITDIIDAAPGRAAEVHKAYMDDYAPTARARGMELEQALISPPIYLTGQSNRLTFVWSVPDTAGFWKARLGGAGMPAVRGFWAKIAPLVVWRDRRAHEEAAAHV